MPAFWKAFTQIWWKDIDLRDRDAVHFTTQAKSYGHNSCHMSDRVEESSSSTTHQGL